VIADFASHESIGVGELRHKPMPVLKLLSSSGNLAYFAAAITFGGIANALACLVLFRMRSAGERIGFWRTHKDWARYRRYWQIAPARNWSRAPIVLALMSFVLALSMMWMSLRGMHIPR
jgi:hypothetical protein